MARMFEVAAHGLVLVDEERCYLHLNAAGCDILGSSREALLGQDLLVNIAEPQHEEARRWFETSMAGHHTKHDLSVTRPDGSEREVSFFCVPVSLEARRVGLAALHDVTAVRRAEHEGRTLTRIAGRLTLKTSVHGISKVLAESVVEATGADASVVVLVSESAPQGHVTGSFGLPEDFVMAQEAALLAGARVGREALEQVRPLIISDLAEYYLTDDAYAPLQPFADTMPWNTLISVPLIYREREVGVLLTFYAPDEQPDLTEADFLQTIAEQSVFALENARLFTETQDKAALEERQRLARELHDSVSQALYGIALGARSARSQLEQSPQRVAERLDYVLKLAEAGLAEMRALIFELRPETLETEGLVGALRKQATAASARHHLEVEAYLDDEPELPFSSKEALYRIVQEALHNIVKHAKAKWVVLRLSREEHKVVLEVRDDGIGFDPNTGFPGHLGLHSMRERAEVLGGAFRLESTPGSGTRVRVELPLRPKSAR